ncbi:MAG TPA: spore cortex biosynthesis protein YabQ [Peptostreptococcaceae bacterium]|nr:spore cortex biosynthesis protein YabQ [Peptostreptococcaceae bacterium]
MMPFTEDIAVFLTTIYGGIIIGLIYDFYRATKKNFKIPKLFTIIHDIVFWIVVTILVFVTINVVESFDLRYYHFVALGIGYVIYLNTISKYILLFFTKLLSLITSTIVTIVKYLVAILINLYYVTIYSIHLLFDIIFYIPNLILNFRGKQKSKVKIKKPKKYNIKRKSKKYKKGKF